LNHSLACRKYFIIRYSNTRWAVCYLCAVHSKSKSLCSLPYLFSLTYFVVLSKQSRTLLFDRSTSCKHLQLLRNLL
jgi:hypothetical protein